MGRFINMPLISNCMIIKETLTSIVLVGVLALGTIGCSKSEGEKASAPKPVASVPTWGTGAGVATGDMNGDGRLDAVVVSYVGNLTANVYLNENLGNGQYKTRKIGSVPTWGTGAGVATGDMNGDGRLDAVVVSYVGNLTANVYELLNNGDGTFSPRE